MKNTLIPTHCPSCNNKLKIVGIHLVCDNKACPEQNILTILHWIVNAGMEQFAVAQVRSLYNAGVVKSVKDLYTLTEDSFSGIEGFGSSKIKNALSEIERTKEMDLPTFVDLLSIEGVGKKFVNKIGIKTITDFMNYNNADDYEYGKNIVAFVKENKSYIQDLLKVVTIKESAKKNTNGSKVCVTGKGSKARNELIADIEAKGDVFVDSVNKETNILVCEDPDGDSSKLVKARKLGVVLMSYKEYFK